MFHPYFINNKRARKKLLDFWESPKNEEILQRFTKQKFSSWLDSRSDDFKKKIENEEPIFDDEVFKLTIYYSQADCRLR
jgi:hypothetical protein